MTTALTISPNNDPRCPECRGVGIRWKAPVASLAVVQQFPDAAWSWRSPDGFGRLLEVRR